MWMAHPSRTPLVPDANVRVQAINRIDKLLPWSIPAALRKRLFSSRLDTLIWFPLAKASSQPGKVGSETAFVIDEQLWKCKRLNSAGSKWMSAAVAHASERNFSVKPHHDLAVPSSAERELRLMDPLAVFLKTFDR
jgi:hypothetical protein